MTTDAESGAGSVFGIAQIVVKPPRSEASVSVAIVPLCSKPGSRRCECRSTNPGRTMQPCRPRPRGRRRLDRLSPISAMMPSATSTSRISSMSFAGSMTRPPRIRIVSSYEGPRCHCQEEQGHAHGHAVRDLLFDHGLAATGDR